MGAYVYLLISAVIGIGFGTAVVVLSHFVGPKRTTQPDLSPYECGISGVDVSSSPHRFDIRFYLVAILFLIFDLEVVFLFPFAYIFKLVSAESMFLVVEMGIFLAILLVGLLYIWKKDVLVW